MKHVQSERGILRCRRFASEDANPALYDVYLGFSNRISGRYPIRCGRLISRAVSLRCSHLVIKAFSDSSATICRQSMSLRVLRMHSDGVIFMQLQTERLVLREFTWSDLDAVYSFESDPAVVMYVCYGPLTKEECRQELAFHIAHQPAQPRMFYHLALVLLSTKLLIGWCGLKLTNPAHLEGELGYALRRAYWGQGYATEAAQAMLAFGFDDLHLHRIVGTCHPANRASIRVFEKVGMSYEGCLREQKWCKGYWRSTSLYAVLDYEWHARQVQNTLTN